MKAVQRRAVARRIQSNWASIVLVAMSITSATAAVAGFKVSVAIAAAVAAVVSGGRILYTDFVLTLRKSATEKATVRIFTSRDGKTSGRYGSAVHIGKRQWLTAAHVVAVTSNAILRIDGRLVEGRVIFQDNDNDLAVVAAAEDYEWRARIGRFEPEPGDKVLITGWPEVTHIEQAHRVTFEYVTQGTTATSRIALTGPAPPAGFSGAPAMDSRTGRLIGLAVTRVDNELSHLNMTHVTPLSALPGNFNERNETTPENGASS